jgi:hypothetical protein
VKTALFVESTFEYTTLKFLVNTHCYGAAVKSSILQLRGKDIKRIILIDGLFCSSRAVWQRELKLALDHGVQIYGASSMGALRALELNQYGMIGHGWIFDQYLSGQIVGDDEVCLQYGFVNGKLIKYTYPLVEIRWMLHQHMDSIDPFISRRILSQLSLKSYLERSHDLIQKILTFYLGMHVSQKLLKDLIHGVYDIKKIDAHSLLDQLY